MNPNVSLELKVIMTYQCKFIIIWGAVPTAYGSSLARDQTHATVVT